MSITLHPIGRAGDGTIRLHKPWIKALDGIEGFSHLIVLFWLHEARTPDLKIHPKGVKRIPKIGYLATRTPHRANPIGATVVRLTKRRGAVLWVEGLDAWDGTPILDIKPYAETDPLRRYASGSDSRLARRTTTQI